MITVSEVHNSNPWWNNPAKIHDDEKIASWESSEIKHDPRLRQEIRYDFDPENTVVYTLRGPRQIGKTTLIKLQIKDFLERGIKPKDILYYSLDIANTPQDIVDVVEIYIKISKRKGG